MTDWSAHTERDRRYHDVIADEYHQLVVDPREMPNDLLFAPLLQRIQKPVKRHLDLGCGTGHMIQRIGKSLAPDHLTAVDHSAGMLDQARAQADRLSIPDAAFVQSDILQFVSDSAATFDLVTCVGVLHHLKPERVPELFEGVSKRLADDGLLLIAEPIDNDALNRFPGWLARWNASSIGSGLAYSREALEPDEHPLPEGFLVSGLEQCGYEIVAENRGMEAFPKRTPPSLLDHVVVRFAQWRYRRSGFIHAVLARKR